MTIWRNIIETGDIKVVPERMSSEESGDAEENDICSVLMYAAEKGDFDLVKTLIEKGADVRHGNKKGVTPLMCAISGNNTAVFRLLLEKGADVDAQTNSGLTALMATSLTGKTEFVKLLLEAGANPDATSKCGKKASDYARDGGYDEIAALLESL